MKTIKIIFILVCLGLNNTALGVSYTPYYPDREHSGNPFGVASYGTSSSITQLEFRSTSSMPVMNSSVRPLETDGTVSGAYTTMGVNEMPKHARKGLDLDEEDEPIGGLVPAGDVPWGLIVLLVTISICRHVKRENIRNLHPKCRFFLWKPEKREIYLHISEKSCKFAAEMVDKQPPYRMFY